MVFANGHLISTANPSLRPSEVAEDAARTVAGVAEVSHTLIAYLQALAADVRQMEQWIEDHSDDCECVCPKDGVSVIRGIGKA